MERQLLIYLDNCVYSNMLKPAFGGLKISFETLPHRFAFSDVHLYEMRHNSDKFAMLLEELDAVFVRNPGAAHGHHHPISSIEFGEPFRRFSEQIEIAPALDAMEAMLLPFHHIMGGRREASMDQIAEAAGTKIKSSFADLFSSLGGSQARGMQRHLDLEIDDITDIIGKSDVRDGWTTMDAQVRAARNGDPMRNMKPIDRVKHVFSSLDATQLEEVSRIFPENFATKKLLKVGDVAGFALMLFALGLTGRKGTFSGKHQERHSAAQNRDTLHIEEASRCDLFITMDRGAFELASATFAYAGFNSTSLLLQSN